MSTPSRITTLVAIAVLALGSLGAQATTLGFDDLPGDGQQTIADGYGGLPDVDNELVHGDASGNHETLPVNDDGSAS